MALKEKVIASYHGFDEMVSEETLPFLETKTRVDWETFEEKWWKWTAEDIVFWWKWHPKIIHFTKYKYGDEKCEGIIKEMKSQEISGKCLDKLDKATLASFGIASFEDRVEIVDAIKAMCTRFPKIIDYASSEGGNYTSMPKATKEIPKEFICPLTNKIMEEPVRAVIDGCVYERHAILQYLEQKRESPKTKKKLHERIKGKDIPKTLLPARRLKNDIELYKAENPSLFGYGHTPRGGHGMVSTSSNGEAGEGSDTDFHEVD